jgi:hypothetical protein
MQSKYDKSKFIKREHSGTVQEARIITSAFQFVLTVRMIRVAVCKITPMIMPHQIP